MEKIYIILAIYAILNILAIGYVIVLVRKQKEPVQLEKKNLADELIAIRYSESMINFIKTMAVQLALMRYREFADNHELDKITRAQILNQISDTAKEANDRIGINKMDFDKLLFDEEFVTTLIVQMTINTFKESLDKSIDRL